MSNAKNYNQSYKPQNNQVSKVTEKSDLYSFIKMLENGYNKDLAKIDLFKAETRLSLNQQQRFVKIYYHFRGHYDRFLFIMGSYAPEKKYKDIVLKNLTDEFGDILFSHEQLYDKFCAAVGVDIIPEIVSEEHYLPFLKKYNYGHYQFLLENNWIAKWSAFSIFESLDNTDYLLSRELVATFGIDKKALTFFDVHMYATHFETTEDLLLECWNEDRESVKKAFEFILSHQLEMWKELSREVLSTGI